MKLNNKNNLAIGDIVMDVLDRDKDTTNSNFYKIGIIISMTEERIMCRVYWLKHGNVATYFLDWLERYDG
jgi:hypothetical protein